MFKPTYLYIKECNCGLKYFGKSTDFKNMKTYKGSGKYWERHLEKHNCKVKTKIYSINKIKQVCMIKALHFSICNNIVKDRNWANCKYENGLDGGDTFTMKSKADQDKIRKKMSIKMKGIIHNGLFKKGNSPWNKGIKTGQQPPEIIEKRRQSLMGKICSNETRKKISIKHKGKILSLEHRKKLSESHKGKQHPQQKVICPHCNKEGAKNLMKRYHFDNCKNLR